MSKRAKAAIAGAATAVALATGALIKPWEGLRTTAYRDVVGVWTVCYGETEGVKPGMKVTPARCEEMLAERVHDDYYKPLARCIAGFDAKPVSWQAAAISLAYNVGVSAVCRSTAARLAREGHYRESCEAMTRFNKAGGKTVRGLVLRREHGDAQRMGELELCLEGLTMPPVVAQPTKPAPASVPAPVPIPAPVEPAKPPVFLFVALAAAVAAGVGFVIWRRRKKA